MTPEALVTALDRLGVELVAAGDILRYRPRERVTPTLLAELRRHKATLLAVLRPRETLKTSTPGGSPEASQRSVVAEEARGTPERIDLVRYYYGGQPETLRDDLRAIWRAAYREALAGGITEPAAWDRAWEVVKNHRAWEQ